ncbi:MAG: phosphate propanoyltransferase [Gracilibacteraceae bacterium]|jgi:putative phosphotransacetylase|nr:phosphate propanoyltransferase [Gracilibacteraceae bacterium]
MKHQIKRQLVELIVDLVCAAQKDERDILSIPVGVSNRHVHLCRRDMDILFGSGYEMQVLRELTQEGYYAARETVVVAGPGGAVGGVRLLGPLRAHTQIELLLTDEKTLGVKIPLRDSGDLGLSRPVTLIGPAGTVSNDTGVMAALRHIHMNTGEAVTLGLRDGDLVCAETQGERSVVFQKIRIRVGNFRTELHLDVDEANACGLKHGDKVRIICERKD